MAKHGLGIPALAAAKRSRKQRMSTLGIDLRSTPKAAPGVPPSSQAAGSSEVPGEALRAANVHRHDGPVLRHSANAAGKKVKPSDSITDTAEALEQYEKDKFAASSTGSRASIERTWQQYHDKAIRKTPGLGDLPLFPLEVKVLAIIAALMKLDGFRSLQNYLSWAKGRHIQLGYQWTLQHDYEARQAVRSVCRGLGAARQSAGFDLPELAKALSGAPSTRRGHPCFPAECAVLGALWVLREIEMAWAAVGDLTVNPVAQHIAWLLPVSKCDARAKACTRPLGCLCGVDPDPLCPYHVMSAYLTRLQDHFGGEASTLQPSFPLFPDAYGKVVRKAGVVGALEELLSTRGVTITDKMGRRLFGGHSFRVTGSRYWVAMGLEVFKLQVFARWGSNVVLRYVAEAPLANLTQVLRGSSSEIAPMGSVASRLEQFVVDAQAQMDALRGEVDRIGCTIRPACVLNECSQIWHRVLICGATHPPLHWKARCGWRFGLAAHTLASAPPADAGCAQLCERCYPPPEELSSDSEFYIDVP